MSRRSFVRTDRLSKQIGEVVATVLLREIREPRLAGVVVTGCDVTRDLSFATIHYYLPLNADQAEVAAALSRASGFIRRRVGQEIRARATPDLRFVYDESVAQGLRIEQILTGIGPIPEVEEPDGPDVDGEAADDGSEHVEDTPGGGERVQDVEPLVADVDVD